MDPHDPSQQPPSDSAGQAPPPPPSGAGEAPPPTPTQDGPHATRFGDEPNNEDKLWGLLAHLSNLFFPVIAPFVVYLIYKDKSTFVGYHAMQSFVMNLIFWAFGGTLVGITCGIAFPILFVPYILSVVWALKANKGEWTGFPLIEGIGK